MEKKRRHRLYIRIAVVAKVLLLVLLGLFQSIWVYDGSASSIMNQCGLQRTRVEFIAKDVLILAYRQSGEHPQAVSELQNVLPLWERTEIGLQVGDTTLGLPTHVPETIAQLGASAQSEYLSIDTAARVILAHADEAPDPLQVVIVLSHEHSYALIMTQINNAWQSQIDSAFLHIFWIEMGLVLAILALVIAVFLIAMRDISS